MHVALAHPDAHVGAAGDPLDVGAEELVGEEQHLAVGGDRLDHLDGVGRRAADVGLGLHLGGRVDVGDDDGARVLGLPGAQLVGGDRVGQRAAGVRVRHQHGLLGRQDLRRLGHEVHAGEDDRRGVARRGDAREGEGVADVVGDVLDLRAPGSCAPGGRRPSRAASRRTSARQASHWSGDQLEAVGAGSVAVTGTSGRGGFLPMRRKPRGQTVTFPLVTSVWSSPDRPAYPHHALAAVLQVRAARLHVMLWRRANDPFAGAWALPGRAAAGRRDARRVGRPAAGVEGGGDAPGAPRAAGDPQRPGARPPRADGRHRLPRAVPSRPRPGAPRGHRLAPASTACRRRPSTTARSSGRRWAGCGPSSRTRTSGSPWPRRRSSIAELRDIYVAALGYEVTATNLQRVLLRRGVLEPTGEMAPPGRAGGRPATLYRFAVPGAGGHRPVRRPPAAVGPPGLSSPFLAEALRFPRGLPADARRTVGLSPGQNRCPAQARGSTTVTTIDSATTTRRRTALKIVGALSAVGAAVAVAGLGTFGQFTDSTSPVGRAGRHRRAVRSTSARPAARPCRSPAA